MFGAAVDCGSNFPNVAAATANVTDLDATTFGQTVEYTCSSGFESAQPVTSTCLSNSTWSDPAYSCNGELFIRRKPRTNTCTCILYGSLNIGLPEMTQSAPSTTEAITQVTASTELDDTFSDEDVGKGMGRPSTQFSG